MSFLRSAAAGYIPGMSMFDSFLHPERGYEQGQDVINQGWNEASGYLEPYSQYGNQEHGRLSNAARRLLHPEQLENDWASGYQMSPYAQDELQRANDIGLNAASSMGLMGSSAGLENLQRTGSSIMNADRRNYLQDLMQKYLAGVQTSQNIFNTGATAGNQLFQGRLQTAEDLAKLRYGAANAPGEMFGNIMGQFASGAGRALAGGY